MNMNLDGFILFIFWIVDIFLWQYVESGGVPVFRLFIFVTFPLVIIYLLICFLSKKSHYFIKTIILTCLLVFSIVFLIGIYISSTTQSINCYVNDSALQQQIALKLLLDKKNPYYEDYYSSLGKSCWRNLYIGQKIKPRNVPNPALEHYIYLPATFIIPIPFYLISNFILNWYDQRLFYLFAYILACFIGYSIFTHKDNKILFLIFIGFNPFLITALSKGHGESVDFLVFLLIIYFLYKKKFNLSSLFLGLGLVTRQWFWLLIPFYLTYIYLIHQKSIKVVFKQLFYTSGLVLIFILPFVLWDFSSFYEDTIKYLLGLTRLKYPLYGLSLGGVLAALKIISPLSSFPFFFISLVLIIPLVVYFLAIMKYHLNLSYLIISFGLSLLIFSYFFRFLNINHLIFILLIIIFGFLFRTEEKHELSQFS